MFISKLCTASLVTLLVTRLPASMLVSLWKVPDAATATLMDEFYRQWRSNQTLGKARALRQAILKTKKEYPDPLSWAAFTLIGLPK